MTYRPGRWYYDPREGALCMTEPGRGELDQRFHVVHVDPVLNRQRRAAVLFLRDNRFMQPAFDDVVHAEDLKIIHRLIDTIQQP